jgi:hypothetical protein
MLGLGNQPFKRAVEQGIKDFWLKMSLMGVLHLYAMPPLSRLSDRSKS